MALQSRWKDFLFHYGSRTIKLTRSTSREGGKLRCAVNDVSNVDTPEKRKSYNLLYAVSRTAIQFFPKSWSAILRSEMWERTYLGQRLYVSVLDPERSLRDDYNVPDSTLLSGLDLPKPPSYTIQAPTTYGILQCSSYLKKFVSPARAFCSFGRHNEDDKVIGSNEITTISGVPVFKASEFKDNIGEASGDLNIGMDPKKPSTLHYVSPTDAVSRQRFHLLFLGSFKNSFEVYAVTMSKEHLIYVSEPTVGYTCLPNYVIINADALFFTKTIRDSKYLCGFRSPFQIILREMAAAFNSLFTRVVAPVEFVDVYVSETAGMLGVKILTTNIIRRDIGDFNPEHPGFYYMADVAIRLINLVASTGLISGLQNNTPSELEHFEALAHDGKTSLDLMLQHPIFWSLSNRIEFYARINNLMTVKLPLLSARLVKQRELSPFTHKSAQIGRFRSRLNSRWKRKFPFGWKPNLYEHLNLEAEVGALLFPGYKNNAADLIRFMRNFSQHHFERSWEHIMAEASTLINFQSHHIDVGNTLLRIDDEYQIATTCYDLLIAMDEKPFP